MGETVSPPSETVLSTELIHPAGIVVLQISRFKLRRGERFSDCQPELSVTVGCPVSTMSSASIRGSAYDVKKQVRIRARLWKASPVLRSAQIRLDVQSVDRKSIALSATKSLAISASRSNASPPLHRRLHGQKKGWSKSVALPQKRDKDRRGARTVEALAGRRQPRNFSSIANDPA